jgi:hypothetical protein
LRAWAQTPVAHWLDVADRLDDAIGDVLGAQQDRGSRALTSQLVLQPGGDVAVGDEIALRARVVGEALGHTVVVGEDEPLADTNEAVQPVSSRTIDFCRCDSH